MNRGELLAPGETGHVKLVGKLSRQPGASMRVSLEERTNYVSRIEYERAYTMIEGATRAKETVDEIFARLEEDPDKDFVLDPRFIALLALICESGRSLARATLAPSELASLQEALAREFIGVRAAFPHLAVSDELNGS